MIAINKLGIDKDESLADFFTPFSGFVSRQYGIPFTKAACRQYDLSVNLGVSRKKTRTILRAFHASDDFKDIQPIEGAQEAIQYLSRDHTLYMITAGDANAKDEIRRWTEHHFPGCFSEVLFSTHYTNENKGPTKERICLEKGIQVMMDDCYEVALPCADAGLDVVLFDQPWNQVELQNEKIRRAFGWDQAVHHIEEIIRTSLFRC